MAIWNPIENLKAWGQVLTSPNRVSNIRQVAGQTVEDIGSRLGVPEMGLSERIAGGPTQRTMRQAYASPSRGRVLGTTPGQGVVYQQPGGGGGQQGGGQDLSSLFMPQPGEPGIDFDALIAPALEGLEAAIGPLQAEFATTQAGIEARRGTQIAGTKQAIGEQVTGLETAKTREEQTAESASNEARRQFAELQQGIQARYGGTTGTGAFAETIAGGQAMRNIAGYRQQLSNALMEADNKIQQVREIGRIALMDIEDKAREQIDQAKIRLENSLADIRRQKGELQSRKAELALRAMELYQSAVNNVNTQNAKFKQDLYMQQVKAENDLKLAMQKASSTAASFKPSAYPLYQLGGQVYRVDLQKGMGQPISWQGQAPTLAPTTVPTKLKEEEEEALF